MSLWKSMLNHLMFPKFFIWHPQSRLELSPCKVVHLTHKWNVASSNVTGDHPSSNRGSPAVGYSSIQELGFGFSSEILKGQ